MGKWGATDSAIMPYGGWGVMFQINLVLVLLGARGGWVGVGVQFKAVKGGEGSKTAARFFASGVGNAAIAGIGDRQLSGAPTPSWQRRLYITEYVLLIQPWRLQL